MQCQDVRPEINGFPVGPDNRKHAGATKQSAMVVPWATKDFEKTLSTLVLHDDATGTARDWMGQPKHDLWTRRKTD